MGLTFTENDSLPNSRLSLQAAEFARANDRFDPFHSAVFQAYFSLGKDIGRIEALTEIGGDVGLDAVALETALRNGAYLTVLDEVRLEAARWNVTAIPRFIVEDEASVVGAQPIDAFRDVLRSY